MNEPRLQFSKVLVSQPPPEAAGAKNKLNHTVNAISI